MLAESGWPKVYSQEFILYYSQLRILATLKEFKLLTFLKSINASNMVDFYYLKIGPKSLRNHFILILYNIGVYIDIIHTKLLLVAWCLEYKMGSNNNICIPNYPSTM